MNNSDTFSQIIEDYIDEHERLVETDAFQSSDETLGNLLAEVWRITQSRPATETAEAIADIRSVILDHIRDRAVSLASNIINRRNDHGTTHPSHVRQWWEHE